MAVYGGQVTGQKKDIGSSIAMMSSILEQNRQYRLKKAQDTYNVLKDLVTEQYQGNWAKAFQEPANEKLVKQFLRYQIGGPFGNPRQVDEMYQQLQKTPMTAAQNIQEILLGVQKQELPATPGQEEEKPPAPVEPNPAPAVKTETTISETPTPEPTIVTPTPPRASEQPFPSLAVPASTQEMYERTTSGRVPKFEDMILEIISEGYVDPSEPLAGFNAAADRARQQFDEIVNGMPDGPAKRDVLARRDWMYREGLQLLQRDPVWKAKVEAAWEKAKTTWSPAKEKAWEEANKKIMPIRLRNTEWDLTPEAAGEGAIMTRREPVAKPAEGGGTSLPTYRNVADYWNIVKPALMSLGTPTASGSFPLEVYQEIKKIVPAAFESGDSLRVVNNDLFARGALALYERDVAGRTRVPVRQAPPSAASGGSSPPPPAPAASPSGASLTSPSLPTSSPPAFSRSKNAQDDSAMVAGVTQNELIGVAGMGGMTLDQVVRGLTAIGKDVANRTPQEQQLAAKTMRAASWKINRDSQRLKEGGKFGDLTPEQAVAFLNMAQGNMPDFRDNPIVADLFSTETTRENRKLTLAERQFEEAVRQFNEGLKIEYAKIGLDATKMDLEAKLGVMKALVDKGLEGIDTSLIKAYHENIRPKLEEISKLRTEEERKTALAKALENDPVGFGNMYNIVMKYDANLLGLVVGEEKFDAVRLFKDPGVFNKFAKIVSLVLPSMNYTGETMTIPTLQPAATSSSVQPLSPEKQKQLNAARSQLGTGP